MAKDKNRFSSVAEEARARMQLAADADSENRAAAIEDNRFSFGDQWPDAIRMQRQLDNRPCLTINKVDTFVRNVVNNMRQQRPRIKVHPVSDGADQQTAKVIEGLMRHIEVQSNAELAYDTGADHQVRMGKGFWRVLSRYIDEKSFDQELYVERIRNPLSVYYDPSSVSPDGLDCTWCIITDRIRKKDFELRYPDFDLNDFVPSGNGDVQDAWSSKEEIMIAEYWRIEEVPEKLLQLNTGKNIFESEAGGAKKKGDMVGDDMVVDVRDSMKRVVKWSKVTRSQELEKRDWPGRYIPVIPVYGVETIDGGKVIRSGMVRQLKDPQMMYNFWRTQETEFVALAPKAPWLMAEGQDEGYENEWATANIKNHSSLKYKPINDESGQMLPPPQRLQPTAVPAASVNAAMAASEDLKAVAGIFDPALGAPGQETSGTMVARRQGQSDLSNYHFYDNLTRSIRATGIILLDLIPHYYSDERVIRIIGEDGNPDSVTINQQAVDKVLNDLSVGRYDVIMSTGPGYDTKRQEAAEMMLQMTKAIPLISQQAADIIVGQMDWPGAKMLQERLRMANPLAQMQEQIPKDIDPKAQEMIGQLMGQLHQAQQQLQQLNQEKQAKVFGVQEREQAISQREMQLSTEREFAETHRLHIREQGENKRAELRAHTELANTEHKDITSMHETIIATNANLEIAHRQALQRGVPNANKPTQE